LDDLLGGKLEKNLSNCLNVAEDSGVLETDQTLQAEGQGLTEKLNVRVVHAEPFLGAEDGDVPAGCEVNLDRDLILALEGVLIVGVSTPVQELTSDMHDGFVVSLDGAADLDHLTRILVDDRVNLGSGVQNIANL